MLTKVKMFLIQRYRDWLYNKSWVKRHVSLSLLSMDDSIDYIIENRCSISRFGDGEFKQILIYRNQINENPDIGFQTYSSELGQRLNEVLTSDHPKLMIGLPSPFFGRSNYKMKHGAALYWRNRHIELFDSIWSLLKPKKLYLDSFISRFYIDYVSSSHCSAYVQHLKKIWDGRNVLIVEGSKTLLGVGNNIFDNAMSIKRIICPAKDAFNSLSDIEKTVVDVISSHKIEDPLILAALGPAATVLSYDLTKAGYQVIDIGHVDVEYEWFLRGATEKISIPGRYVNEAVDSPQALEECQDEKYKSQIVARVK